MGSPNTNAAALEPTPLTPRQQPEPFTLPDSARARIAAKYGEAYQHGMEYNRLKAEAESMIMAIGEAMGFSGNMAYDADTGVLSAPEPSST